MKLNMNILRFALVVTALLPLAASAQNLDPTVEVSRTYEGKLMEVHKPQLEMAVPDSVLRFDLEFDYSVTDKPYKGAYEFSPYTVEMKPSPTVYEHNKLYLKAGAGYQLRPELDVLWSPEFKTNAFNMNVYANHRSYFGSYWRLEGKPGAINNGYVVDRFEETDVMQNTWKGYDVVNRAGVNGRADWKNGVFRFDVGYNGLMQDESMAEVVNRYYDELDVNLALATKKQTGFLYRLDAGYKISGDNGSMLAYGKDYADLLEVRASELDFLASLGYARKEGRRFMFDLGVEYAEMDHSPRHHGLGYGIDMVPHYMLETGRWFFDLGVRFSGAMCESLYTDSIGPDGQLVYPDVRVEYRPAKGSYKLYLDVSGDTEVNSYSDVLKFNRHYNPYWTGVPWELLDASEEKVNAVLGAEARIGSRFSFDLRGGFVAYGDGMLDGIYVNRTIVSSSYISSRLFPTVGYVDYQKIFVALDWLLDTESVRFGGNIEYGDYVGTYTGSNMVGLFLPAAFTGDVSFEYIWKKRLNVGVDCQFASARDGHMRMYTFYSYGDPVAVYTTIPGYADLGVNAEFAVNRKFSVWARGGNLLNMTIQRSPLYAEKGPYFTAGICLNL